MLKMITIRRILLVILIGLPVIISSLIGQTVTRFVNSPGGFINESGGATTGQTAIGDNSSDGTSGDDGLGFWYNDIDPLEICFNITPDSWSFPESLDVFTEYIMEVGDQISITNCGNCHLKFGIQYVSSSPIEWDIGSTAAVSQFILRARFESSTTAPETFSHSYDYISSTVRWASDENFGSLGNDFQIADDLYLWLQLTTPTLSSAYGENTITISLIGQVDLP